MELGLQLGYGEFDNTRIKLDYINSFILNPYFSIGIGTGIRYYFHEIINPLFVDMRVNFTDSKVTPYISTAAGYSFDLQGGQGGGYLFNPMIGLSFKGSKDFAFNLGFGYELQRTRVFNQSYYGDKSTTTETSVALSVIIGFSF